MQEKPYFPGPEISWKAQAPKYQVNIIFTSTFWLKKTVFPITEKFKTRTFQEPVNIIFPSTFSLKKRPYFPPPKKTKQELFSHQEILYFHQLFE